MKFRYVIISLALLIGCSDDDPDIRELPIIKTLYATNVNDSGANLQGEILNEGDWTITSLGFVWGGEYPQEGISPTVVIGEDISSSLYSVRIDSLLIPGLDYYAKAFITYDNKTEYGDLLTFSCKESSKSGWSQEMKEIVDIESSSWGAPYGFTDNEIGYIIFPSSPVYSFNSDQNELVKIDSFPDQGNTGTRFTSTTIKGEPYLVSDVDKNLYRFSSGVWEKQSQIPFYYGYFVGYYHGFSVSDEFYILSSTQSYMYNVATRIWEQKAKIPMHRSGYSVGGADVNNKAYLMTNDKLVWEYDPIDDLWVEKSKYPGILYDKIVSFSFNGNLYFGLSYHDHDVSQNWMDRSFWKYNPESNEWVELQSFPLEVYSTNLFFLSLKGKLYVGYGRKGKYRIWKFDPLKA